MRGADAIAHALERVGARVVFTVSGNHVMSVFDALLETPIRLIHARHEAAAVPAIAGKPAGRYRRPGQRVAPRVPGLPHGGEVLASQTVRDLVAGSIFTPSISVLIV